MSEFTKTAIYSTFTGDTALADLLGTDENGAAAVFNATMNQKQQDIADPSKSWTYPCVTFRESDGVADSRFTTSAVGTEFFDIEVWWQTSSALTGARIAARIESLLHNRSLIVSSGRVYHCERVSQIPDQYDSKLKVHFGLYRYKLVVGN